MNITTSFATRRKHQAHWSLQTWRRCHLLWILVMPGLLNPRQSSAVDLPAPRAGAEICVGGQFKVSPDGTGPILHSAANCFVPYMLDLGDREFEPGVATGVTLEVADSSQNMVTVALDLALPACLTATVDGTNTGGYVQYDNISVKSYTFNAVINPKDILFTVDTGKPKGNGRYSLPADGHSKATLSTPGSSLGSHSFSMQGDPNTASLDAA